MIESVFLYSQAVIKNSGSEAAFNAGAANWLDGYEHAFDDLIIEGSSVGNGIPRKLQKLVYFIDAYAMFLTLPDSAASTGSGLFA